MIFSRHSLQCCIYLVLCCHLLSVICSSWSIPGEGITLRGLSRSSGRLDNITLSFVYEDDVGPFRLVQQGPAVRYEFIEQRALGHFNRERIPERVVHAKGSTFYGDFIVTNPDISRFTKASLFGLLGKSTRVAARFSTSLGERGSSDTPLGEVRGLGVKFYTDDGNLDILSINTPVFVINDPQFFVSLTHAQKRDPKTDRRSADNLWDFISLHTESLNALAYLYSDYGLPDGFRHMPAFSVNTFRLVNSNNRYYYTRFMWIPEQGIKNLPLSEAIRLSGEDPDYGRRILFESIESKNFPSWKLYVQIADLAEVESGFGYNPFDATKLWPYDRFPPIEVGIMTLNQNVHNSFAENEQIALNPANLIPGIEPSPDLLLRGRLFAYRDAQVYRLGANHLLIPVNQDSQKALNDRDAAMRTDGNFGSKPNYYPNSRNLDRPDLYDVVPRLLSDSVDHFLLQADSLEQQYRHARQSYLSLSTSERHTLHSNLAFVLSSITKKHILKRILRHLFNIYAEYGNEVRKELFRHEAGIVF